LKELDEASKWASELNDILADMIREFKKHNRIMQKFEEP